MSKFKTPVTMQVTQEQLENDLLPKLLKLGYDGKYLLKNDYNFTLGYTTLSNCYGNHNQEKDLGIIGLTRVEASTHITKYNPKLFLSIAAMTEGEDWIVGEWLYYKKFKSINYDKEFFEVKELFGCNTTLVYAHNNCKKYYRKATLQELLKHFGKTVVEDYPVEKKPVNSRFPFQLSLEDGMRIIDIACSEWKSRLVEKWSTDLVLHKSVTIHEDEYNTMRKTCTTLQNELFDNIFGKDVVEETYKVGDRFNIFGSEYILAKTNNGSEVVLINLKDGGRWSDYFKVSNTTAITHKEIQDNVGVFTFEKIS